MDPLFTRDGHLSDLTLERLLHGEISPDDLAGHLTSCARCEQRHRALLTDAAADLPPLRRLRLVTPVSTLLGRDGHLTDLTLERLLHGEPDTAEAQEHLDDCGACAQRHRALLADAAADLPPLRLPTAPVASAPAPLPDNVVPLSRERPWWSAAGGLLAAAAAVLLLVNIGPTTELPLRDPPDHFTKRSADLPALSLEVYRSASGDIARISSDDVVFPGDRLGFRVGSEADGHLLILGIDSTGKAYPCYPSDGTAAAIQHGGPAEVPGAINLDDTLGIERLLAVRCPDPVPFGQLAGALEAAAAGLSPDSATPQLKEQCAQRELRLRKEPRP
jgi:bacterioferritin-associated ferredoxin